MVGTGSGDYSKVAGGRARHLHIVSCTPASGKSVVTTALLRAFRDDGMIVLPFKPVAEVPGKFGDPPQVPAALTHQCFAAGVELQPSMNPVRVVANECEGEVWLLGRRLGTVPVIARDTAVLDELPSHLVDDVSSAIAESIIDLRERCDLMVSEGAGGCGDLTELGFRDIPNIETAAAADRVVLITRAGKGATFSALEGVIAILRRAGIDPFGFIVNDLRSCEARYISAARALATSLEVATLGTIRWTDFFRDRPKFHPPTQGCVEDQAHLAALVREGLEFGLIVNPSVADAEVTR